MPGTWAAPVSTQCRWLVDAEHRGLREYLIQVFLNFDIFFYQYNLTHKITFPQNLKLQPIKDGAQWPLSHTVGPEASQVLYYEDDLHFIKQGTEAQRG